MRKIKLHIQKKQSLSTILSLLLIIRLQENKDKTTLSIYFFIPRLERSTNSSFIKRIKEYFFLKFIIFKNKKSIKSFQRFLLNIENNNNQNIKQP